MKANLEFNLPEEGQEFQDACDGTKWKCLVWQFDQHMRKEVKYNDKLSDEVHNAIADLRKLLYEMLNEEGLLLD